jgi:hypothetical protein
LDDLRNNLLFLFEKRFGKLPYHSELLSYNERFEAKKQWDKLSIFELGFMDAIELMKEKNNEPKTD